MDQGLIDVTALRGEVAIGDNAMIIGRQGDEQITSDELAEKLATINYQIVTAIAHRVPRVAAGVQLRTSFFPAENCESVTADWRAPTRSS